MWADEYNLPLKCHFIIWSLSNHILDVCSKSGCQIIWSKGEARKFHCYIVIRGAIFCSLCFWFVLTTIYALLFIYSAKTSYHSIIVFACIILYCSGYRLPVYILGQNMCLEISGMWLVPINHFKYLVLFNVLYRFGNLE